MSGQQEETTPRTTVVLVVPKEHVKSVKSALEECGQLDRTTKITPETADSAEVNPSASSEVQTPSILEHGSRSSTSQFPALNFDIASGQYVDSSVLETPNRSSARPSQGRMRIPTTIPYTIDDPGNEPLGGHNDDQVKAKILQDLSLHHLLAEVSISYQIIQADSKATSSSKNPLCKALKEALDLLEPSVLIPLGLTPEVLVSTFPDAYSIYKPMLLLPHNAFSSEPWQKLLSTQLPDSATLRPVWQHISTAVGTTHVAINSPIPPQTDTSYSQKSPAEENILRSPVNLNPIYGDFGAPPSPQTLSNPTHEDFKTAFWVSTTQNGIHQTWAPRYTMFSRGNIREKSRTLHLPSVAQDFDCPSSAADLYAGIGYFVFSYMAAGSGRANGIKTVLCWELNPWSVEGLRRGAEMNGWKTRIWNEQDTPSTKSGWEVWKHQLSTEKGTHLWIFQMSNEHAGTIIQHLNNSTTSQPLLLPIRHVNLGLLPTSTLSWRTAVQILDQQRGGWIHVHENVGVKDVEARRAEVELEFQRLVNEYDNSEGRGSIVEDTRRQRSVRVEHVERVKMYAPGVVHAVFDVAASGVNLS
ncbi:hypothetical protein IQ07DRAFT_500430 [Pyrenochaeta sp. DS3sAY3a]|nr:hypothetical protein IQ07DRAFT_500430 [Pyrenochaeta sp. DS3sAY3a]